MEDGYQCIAQGASWSKAWVLSELKSVLEGDLDPLIYKVEHYFTVCAQELGCKAEWSIRFSEVNGYPTDFQFDIDDIRAKAIDRCIEDLT
jgi:hypothetical protein